MSKQHTQAQAQAVPHEEQHTQAVLPEVSIKTIKADDLNGCIALLSKFSHIPLFKRTDELFSEEKLKPVPDYDYEIKRLEKEIAELEKKKPKFPPVTEKPADFEPNLFKAVFVGKLSSVQYLIEVEHKNPNRRRNWGLFDSGGTPLHTAAEFGHLDIVKYLIEECHCDLEAKDRYRNTPLHQAVRFGHLNIVKYLIEDCHCDPKEKNNNGWTPLFTASQEGHLEVVKYLIEECHCDPNEKNSDGWTPLFTASQEGYLDIVK